ncbi:MAG: hypothetical protein WCL06_11280, partial [Bacteroidota bacterium]
IISEHPTYVDILIKRNTFPPPPPPPGQEYYTKLIFLFDSTDRVYLYQTSSIDNYDTARKYNSEINNFNYPSYIGLKPQHFVSFTSQDFIAFIKNNDDILELDTTKRKYDRFIYIGSNKDTIKNNGYYDLISLISPKSKIPRYRKQVFFITRRTTEEENNVIYYKRRNIPYTPEKIKWSTNFITGNCRPFTKEYDSIEKRMFYIIKAGNTFAYHCTSLNPIW